MLVVMVVVVLVAVVALVAAPAWAKRRGTYGSDDGAATGGGGGGNANANAGDGKEKDSELLDRMLRESEVVAMIEHEQAKHERRLNDLHQRLERELASVQQHFEQVMQKLRITEQQLEQNLRNVERAIAHKVDESKKSVKAHSDSWRWPFFVLILMIGGVAAFFGNLYRKATKHNRML